MAGSCNLLGLLQSNPTQALLADGTTVAQYVYGRGKPADGLYCPQGPVTACAAGSFCPNTSSQLICPLGHFCPVQTAQPQRCSWLASCPTGSANPGLPWGPFMGLLAVGLVLWAAWLLLHGWIRHRRLQQAKRQLRQAKLQRGGTPSRQRWAGLTPLDVPIAIRMTDLQWQQTAAAYTSGAMTAAFPHSRLHCIVGQDAEHTRQLLLLLAGRGHCRIFAGSLTFNGAQQPPRKRGLATGYVPARPALHGSLTVRQNLQYAASLRLPAAWSRQRKQAAVDDVLHVLQLQHVQHCLVDSLAAAGAGGEAYCHMAAVAAELVTSPALLCIDQPLQRLGRQHACALVASLHAAARQLGMNIILATNDMPDAALGGCDTVIVLGSDGQATVQGAPNQMLAHLSFLGVTHPAGSVSNITSLSIDAYSEGIHGVSSSPPRPTGSAVQHTACATTHRQSNPDINQASKGCALHEGHRHVNSWQHVDASNAPADASQVTVQMNDHSDDAVLGLELSHGSMQWQPAIAASIPAAALSFGRRSPEAADDVKQVAQAQPEPPTTSCAGPSSQQPANADPPEQPLTQPAESAADAKNVAETLANEWLSTPPSSLGSPRSVADLAPDWNNPCPAAADVSKAVIPSALDMCESSLPSLDSPAGSRSVTSSAEHPVSAAEQQVGLPSGIAAATRPQPDTMDAEEPECSSHAGSEAAMSAEQLSTIMQGPATTGDRLEAAGSAEAAHSSPCGNQPHADAMPAKARAADRSQPDRDDVAEQHTHEHHSEAAMPHVHAPDTMQEAMSTACQLSAREQATPASAGASFAVQAALDGSSRVAPADPACEELATASAPISPVPTAMSGLVPVVPSSAAYSLQTPLSCADLSAQLPAASGPSEVEVVPGQPTPVCSQQPSTRTASVPDCSTDDSQPQDVLPTVAMPSAELSTGSTPLKLETAISHVQTGKSQGVWQRQLSSPASSVSSPRSLGELISDWRAPRKGRASRQRAAGSATEADTAILLASASALDAGRLEDGAHAAESQHRGSPLTVSPVSSAGSVRDLVGPVQPSGSSGTSLATCGAQALQRSPGHDSHDCHGHGKGLAAEHDGIEHGQLVQPVGQLTADRAGGVDATPPQTMQADCGGAGQQPSSASPAHHRTANEGPDQQRSELQGVETDPQRDASFSTQHSSGSMYTDGRMSPYSDAERSTGRSSPCKGGLLQRAVINQATGNPLYGDRSPGSNRSQSLPASPMTCLPNQTERLPAAGHAANSRPPGQPRSEATLGSTSQGVSAVASDADQTVVQGRFGLNPLFRRGAWEQLPPLSHEATDAFLVATPENAPQQGLAQSPLPLARKATGTHQEPCQQGQAVNDGLSPPCPQELAASATSSPVQLAMPTSAPKLDEAAKLSLDPAAVSGNAAEGMPWPWETTVSIVARKLEGAPEAWPALDDVVPDLGSESIQQAIEEKLSPGADADEPMSGDLTWATRVLQWRLHASQSRSPPGQQGRQSTQGPPSPVGKPQPTKRKLYSSENSFGHGSAVQPVSPHAPVPRLLLHSQNLGQEAVRQEGSMSSLLCQVLGNSPVPSVCSTPTSHRPRKRRPMLGTPRSPAPVKAAWQSPGPIRSPVWQPTAQPEASPGSQQRGLPSRPLSRASSVGSSGGKQQQQRVQRPAHAASSPAQSRPASAGARPTSRRPASPAETNVVPVDLRRATSAAQPLRQLASSPAHRRLRQPTGRQNEPLLASESPPASPKSVSPQKQPAKGTTFGGSRYANQGSTRTPEFQALAAASNPFLFPLGGSGLVAEGLEAADAEVSTQGSVWRRHEPAWPHWQHKRHVCRARAGPVAEATRDSTLELLPGGSWSSSEGNVQALEHPRDVETGDAPACGQGSRVLEVAGTGEHGTAWWQRMWPRGTMQFSNPMSTAGSCRSVTIAHGLGELTLLPDRDSSGIAVNPLCAGEASQVDVSRQPPNAAEAAPGGEPDHDPAHSSSRSNMPEGSSQHLAQSHRQAAGPAVQVAIVARYAVLSALHQAVSWKLLDLLLAVTLGMVLGVLHGIDTGPEALPQQSMAAMLLLGTLSTIMALPCFGGGRSWFMQQRAVGVSPGSYFLGTAAVHAVPAVVRTAVYLAVYASTALPGIPFGQYYAVALSVTAWCSGLGHLLAVMAGPEITLRAALVVPVVLLAVANGVSPALRVLGGSPLYLVSGLSYLRWAVEAITIHTLPSTPAAAPVMLRVLARQGFCGVQRMLAWDEGEWISEAQAQQLHAMLAAGPSMCRRFVQHDLLALLVQALLLYLLVLLALYRRRAQHL